MGFKKGGLIFVILLISVLDLAVGAEIAEEQYQRIALDLHNQHRSGHHVDPLTGSDDLNSRAVQCAEYYAAKGTIDHSCPHKNGAGENLFAHWSSGGFISDEGAAESASNGWYSEESRYDYDNPIYSHFTQMVWKNSRELGFGTGRSNSTTYVCALYSPPGNYAGEFDDNVLRP